MTTTAIRTRIAALAVAAACSLTAFATDATAADVNRDGRDDIIVGPQTGSTSGDFDHDVKVDTSDFKTP